MAELKENQLIITDEEGNETLCEILFTFDSEEFNKSYVFFYEAGNYQEDDEVEVSFAAWRGSYLLTQRLGDRSQVFLDYYISKEWLPGPWER